MRGVTLIFGKVKGGNSAQKFDRDDRYWGLSKY